MSECQNTKIKANEEKQKMTDLKRLKELAEALLDPKQNQVVYAQRSYDFYLAANPSAILDLIDKYEERGHVIEALKNGTSYRILELEDQLKRAVEVVRFYGDVTHWDGHGFVELDYEDKDTLCILNEPHGKRARDFLASIESEK